MSDHWLSQASKPVASIRPCTCPGANREFAVALEAWNEGDAKALIFLGGGDTPGEAVTDAEDHAFAALGDDAITGSEWPA